MTQARSTLIDPSSTPYYHCIARCVRRAWLCGEDHLTGKNYEHRRQWVVDRLEALVDIFAIEVCAYAVMSNHYHVVLHINRHPANKWNRDEVLKRWTSLFSGPFLVQRYLARDQLSSAELARVDDYAETYRNRLMDISWFMRCLNEHLAREANKEDGCKGRFWEGRFKSQALLDEAALLTCMAYVDLNPVRAKMAKTPETSDFTSVQQRAKQLASTVERKQPVTLKPFRMQGQKTDLALPYTLYDYFDLVDWSGRAVRLDKRGSIASNMPPILAQLGINPEEWIKTMGRDNRFYRAAGRVEAMKACALSVGQQWMQGIEACRRLFALS
ncbi:transposase [Endozoicomonadaceae bacterium StTr2]